MTCTPHNTSISRGSSHPSHFLRLIFFLLALSAISSAQATFTTLHSFQGTDGAYPYYMYLVQGADGNLYGTTSAQGAFGSGTVFRISTKGAFTTIYSFCSLASCVDGSTPTAGLLLASNGNFYGTTTGGGAVGNGTAYQITPSGKLTSLYSFCSLTDCDDGSEPYVGLIQASNGNLYGTTSGGGSYTYGTLFQLTLAGTLTTLHTFSGQGNDGAYPDARLLQGSNGLLYGTTYESSAFEMTTAGQFTLLSNFNGNYGAGPTGAMIQASNGNYYGTTTEGGTNGAGTIYEMTAAGNFTTLYNFCSLAACADGDVPYGGLMQATDGNLYGTTYSGGANGEGTIFKITTSGVLTTLYNFCSQAGCADGAAPEEGLMQDTNGTLYGATSSGGTGNAGTIYSLSVKLGAFLKASPASGKVGASVTIFGSNLAGSTAISFNGTAATLNTVTNSEILTTVPSGATTGKITVTTPTRTVSTSVNFKVIPQITSFSPGSGAVGTQVTITGVSLTQTSKVTFGGIAATSFTVNSDGQVTATVPTGAVTGKIAITTPGGTATSSTTFTVT